MAGTLKQTIKSAPRTSSYPGVLTVLPGSNRDAEVVRLFHTTPCDSREDAAALLSSALAHGAELPNFKVLLTGAGLVLEEASVALATSKPDENEFKEICEQACSSAEELRARLNLKQDGPAILLGIDICSDGRHVGQFAALLWAEEVCLVPKGLPTCSEASYVFVPPDAEHRITTPLEPDTNTMIFVCHDLMTYSARGIATTKNIERKNWRQAIQRAAKGALVSHALHLAHWLKGTASFIAAYNAWAQKYKDVPLLGAAGLYEVDSEDQAQEIAAAMRRPWDYPTFDLWAR